MIIIIVISFLHPSSLKILVIIINLKYRFTITLTKNQCKDKSVREGSFDYYDNQTPTLAPLLQNLFNFHSN